MLYCSIDEAWGMNNISKHTHKKKYKKKIIENFTESVKEIKELSEIDCKRIMKHIMKCQNVKELSKNLDLNYYFYYIIIDENEMIVLILMGIF